MTEYPTREQAFPIIYIDDTDENEVIHLNEVDGEIEVVDE